MEVLVGQSNGRMQCETVYLPEFHGAPSMLHTQKHFCLPIQGRENNTQIFMHIIFSGNVQPDLKQYNLTITLWIGA
uniref:Uncharacterized protein n=1 Tax=Anguilla anguilla TaxID=7936 RepID=A0A0E9TJM7_ANGAN